MTIGWGHTKNVKKGNTCTLCQAQKWFEDDLSWCEAAINKYVKNELTQNQFDALCSFVFNVGESRFSKSLTIGYINESVYKTKPEVFKKRYLSAFVTANGIPCNGLVNRRLKEFNLWIL